MSEWRLEVCEDNGCVSFGARMIREEYRHITGTELQAAENGYKGNSIRISVDTSLSDGYVIDIPEEKDGTQFIEICGSDAAMTMYACSEFANIVLPKLHRSNTSCSPYYFHPLFTEKALPKYHFHSSPAVKHRGLWTWGHVIYDYRGFFENMARLRLNEVIIWNDFPPLNAKEVVEKAHSLGIKVIWGYAWGWDTGMRIDTTEDAVNAIVNEYEEGYAGIPGDGIYFQSFTETTKETLDGRLIAEAVVDFVNRISERLLEKHPDLLLQFGLHAMSVKNRLDIIAETDSRVHIVWEDCGAFPYHYIVTNRENAEETNLLTKKILDLRQNAVCGAVLKGMICLNWNRFAHMTAPMNIGCADGETIQRRRDEIKPILHILQADWAAYGEPLAQIVRMYAEKDDAELYGLYEDGVLERDITLPVAVFADTLWDPSRDYADILHETMSRPDISFI